MSLYVKDPQVDALARELTALKGTTKTEAVRQALQNELARERGGATLVERTLAFTRGLKGRAGPGGAEPDKGFIDGLYES